MSNPPRILVLGLGNELLRDDGAGVHVARILADCANENTRVIDIGTALLQVVDDLEWADYVVGIDALNAGNEPGSLYYVERDSLRGPDISLSLHDLDLHAVVNLTDRATPPVIHVLGIEPKQIEYGLELTEPVALAVPKAARYCREQLSALRSSWLSHNVG